MWQVQKMALIYAVNDRAGRLEGKAIITSGLLNIHVYCRDKLCLSRQNYVCSDKNMRQNFWRVKIMFVATNICHGKGFVATKMILVAAPANDTPHVPLPPFSPTPRKQKQIWNQQLRNMCAFGSHSIQVNITSSFGIRFKVLKWLPLLR